MLALLIFSVILGGIVAGVTGIGILFWVVSVFVFICGLPAALITGFISGQVKYSQDRADLREKKRQIAENEREIMRTIREEERDDYNFFENNQISYNSDAHSKQYFYRSGPKARDKNGKFISKK